MSYLVIPKDMYQGQLPATITTLYTAPSLTSPRTQKAIIKEIIVCNTDTAAHTYTLEVVPSGGSAGASKMIAAQISLPANTTDKWGMSTIIPTGGTLRGYADSASKVTVTASGVELL